MVRVPSTRTCLIETLAKSPTCKRCSLLPKRVSSGLQPGPATNTTVLHVMAVTCSYFFVANGPTSRVHRYPGYPGGGRLRSWDKCAPFVELFSSRVVHCCDFIGVLENWVHLASRVSNFHEMREPRDPLGGDFPLDFFLTTIRHQLDWFGSSVTRVIVTQILRYVC